MNPIISDRKSFGLKQTKRYMYNSRKENDDHSEDFIRVANAYLSNFPEETFYFFNVGELRHRFNLLETNFLPNNPNAHTAYAVKSNPKNAILKKLSEFGMDSFDCASLNEIAAVKNIDPNATILYNHPIKRECDIRAASKMGVSHFTVQSLEEIKKIQKNYLSSSGDRLEITVRIAVQNPDAEINLSSKFGATEEEARVMLQYLYRKTNAIPGISTHVGSQNRSPHSYVRAIKQMSSIVKDVCKIGTFNIGGGFPADYLGETQTDIRDYFQYINSALEKELEGLFVDENHKILIEPGRFLVAEPATLVIPIVSVDKRGDEPCIYIHDGIFTSFCKADPPNADASFAILRMNQNDLNFHNNSPSIKYRVFGNTCDSADELRRRMLPIDLKAGDWVCHFSAGAYADACASSFNGFDLPNWVHFNN